MALNTAPKNSKATPNPKLGSASARPPIVVVMGHVDHGKTTLLDYIRKANVAAREAGGITQAVGAYEIVHNGRKITFMDTPGHEAFSKMRSRGAEVADLAILVVSADDGVKQQTKEAIDILLAAKTPFIVAINKIDRTGGSIEKAKGDLAKAGVLLEGFGGQVSYHGISAKTGEGVGELLDLVVLAADLENLTCDLAAPASGYIFEVRHDSRRGAETSVIVKNGSLKRGQNVYTKTAAGKVRILENFLGETVSELVPSAPALILGFEVLPQVGEIFSTEPSVQAASARKTLAKNAVGTGTRSEKPTLNLILKASDAGSLEALSIVLKAVDRGGKQLNVIEESVGDATDGDLQNAIATGAHIIGFKIRVQKGAKNLAEAHGVKIVTSEIIYDLVKTVEEFFNTIGKPPALGELEVLAVFNQKKLDEQLVGGRVTLGTFRTKAGFDISRGTDGENHPTGNGKVLSLHDKKLEINSAEVGKEIGVQASSQTAIAVGDRLIIRK